MRTEKEILEYYDEIEKTLESLKEEYKEYTEDEIESMSLKEKDKYWSKGNRIFVLTGVKLALKWVLESEANND